MDDNDRPNLSLGDLAYITEQHYQADQAAWEALRPLLKPKEWDETTRFKGPRPPKRASEFYLILSNYSTEVFFLEANRYPRYPPNPHSRNWLINLARRVEDHVIGVVADIESSDYEKDFSYHGVAEGEMRRTIRQRLEGEMKDHFPIEFPRVSTPPPCSPKKPTPEELRKIGIDPENMSPLLQDVIKQQTSGAVSPSPPKHEQNFSKALDQLLRDKNIRPEELADKMEIEWSTVYRHISGKHSPNRDTLKRYTEALTGILGYPVSLPTPAKRQRAKKTPIKRQ